MQIILVQAEIEAAIRAYIAPFIASEGVSVSIDMSATRGTDGFKALIDIVPLGQEVLMDEPATLGIADKIAEAQADAPAEAAPVRRTRRTAAQIAADNAAAAASPSEDEPEAGAEAAVELQANEEGDLIEAPAPRQSLFGNLNVVKNS